MANKPKGQGNMPKRQTVPLVTEPGQTLVEALKAAWVKAHNAR